jgi:hypothetical protein
MKLLRNVSTLLAASVLLAAYSVNAFAQEKDNKQRETTLTGCLNKDPRLYKLALPGSPRGPMDALRPLTPPGGPHR